MPPPPVPPLQNQTNSKDVNSQKRIQMTNENLLRITLIKTAQFEDEYIIKEVNNHFIFVNDHTSNEK